MEKHRDSRPSTPRELFLNICDQLIQGIEEKRELLREEHNRKIRSQLLKILSEPTRIELLEHLQANLNDCMKYWDEQVKSCETTELNRRFALRTIKIKTLRIRNKIQNKRERDKFSAELTHDDIQKLRKAMAECLIKLGNNRERTMRKYKSFTKDSKISREDEESQISEILDIIKEIPEPRRKKKRHTEKKKKKLALEASEITWTIEKKEREASKSGRIPKKEARSKRRSGRHNRVK